MKIKISYTLEVDQAEWASEYGIDMRDVREDVKGYFNGSDIIPEHLQGFVKSV